MKKKRCMSPCLRSRSARIPAALPWARLEWDSYYANLPHSVLDAAI